MGSSAQHAQSVLIVEDSWLLAEQVESWLSDDGIAIAGKASSPSEALSLARAGQPGFAIVDLNLGGESAFGLIENLRSQRIKVVVVTGYSNIAPREGVAAVLQKPCTKEALVGALRAAGLQN